MTIVLKDENVCALTIGEMFSYSYMDIDEPKNALKFILFWLFQNNFPNIFLNYVSSTYRVISLISLQIYHCYIRTYNI